MFGLNPFELAMMFVFTALALAAAQSFAGTPPIRSGRIRLLLYGLVLLACAAAFLNIVESKTGMTVRKLRGTYITRMRGMPRSWRPFLLSDSLEAAERDLKG